MGESLEIPLIKEYRLRKLVQVMRCFKENPFNRSALKECILNLYPGKEEKSVFRGMVIPSLRHLGLIVGYGEDLRLSANGNLLMLASEESPQEGLRVFRCVLLEIDGDTLCILGKSEIKKGLDMLAKQVKAPSDQQARERVRHWLSMLTEAELIRGYDPEIESNAENLLQTLQDLDSNTKGPLFEQVFFESYESIFKKQGNVPVVDIDEVRREAAVKYYEKHKVLLTEKQFDNLLRKMPLTTEHYIISLGRAMGAEEKVLEHAGSYYRTLSVRFLEKEDKKP